jgi:hypothetical protein
VPGVVPRSWSLRARIRLPKDGLDCGALKRATMSPFLDGFRIGDHSRSNRYAIGTGA